jgi:hypothetical protein
MRRIVSAALALAAVGWGVSVVNQAQQTDDGGPPIGALCAASPGFLLLIAAGAVWPQRKGVDR